MKKTSEIHRGNTARSGLTAISAAIVMALAGCSGTGSLNTAGTPPGTSTGGGGGGGGAAGSNSPVAAVVRETSNTVSDAGQTVGSLGTQVQQVGTPLVGAGAASALGAVVNRTGGAVDALGSAVSSGLGQLGAHDNPLGHTVSNLSGSMDQLGRSVSSASDVVTGLSNNPATARLRPVTEVAGQVVGRVGEAVSRTGSTWETHTSTGPLGQALKSGGRTLEGVVEAGVGATQSAGSASGLGAPLANGAMTPITQTMGQAGQTLTGSSGSVPGAQGLGEVLGNTSRTLTATGGLVNAPAGASPVNPVQQVGPALNTLIVPIATGLTTTAGSVNGASGLGAPLGQLLIGSGTAMQQLSSGLQGNGAAPQVGHAAAVVQQTGSAMSNVGVALGGTVGAAPGTPVPAAGALVPVVSTVNGTVGGLLGSLRR